MMAATASGRRPAQPWTEVYRKHGLGAHGPHRPARITGKQAINLVGHRSQSQATLVNRGIQPGASLGTEILRREQVAPQTRTAANNEPM